MKNYFSNFAENIFVALKKLDDIKSAKWAVRLVSLVGGDNLDEQIFDFIQELYTNGRAKEARYFVECLIYAKKSERNRKFAQDH